ncbi:putative cell wall-binding domain [Desulfosporosinus sp. I2]|uniref:cell wall-binding repeat-containing protein n=1 Tax=Desulfosporosinus sp. I2 TaxID=1617025 RepID=UPI0005EE5AC6|nr:cell wall-binding repeat-containing protein [Desulfosporosinus sp. I2]KJR48480.1 putative cell wall-binding domain [Desulfosporosinus sp. I2]
MSSKKRNTSVFLLITMIFTLSFPALAFANTSPTLTRLAGFDRYETASQIAKSGWSQSDYAILAFGENYPDALSSAPLAKKYNAPILLTNSNSLPNTTKQTLIDLHVKNVIIIGGTGVIYASVESELESMGVNTTRIFGNDKYDTAIKVAQQITTAPSELFVVTGEDYPDALSVASIACIKEIPIILVPNDSIPDSVVNYISTINVNKTYEIGYSDIISDKVCNQFPNTERILGADKYARNIVVSQRFNSDFKSDSICVATGEGFADALTGAAYSAKLSEPIILINNDSPTSTKGYYHQRVSNTSNVYVFGGTGIISDSVIQNLNIYNVPKEDTVSPMRVRLNKSSITINVGGVETLMATLDMSKATVDPVYGNANNVTWVSSNPDVARVSLFGNIIGLNAGTAVITVTTTDGSEKATCEVTVSNPNFNGNQITLSVSNYTKVEPTIATFKYKILDKVGTDITRTIPASQIGAVTSIRSSISLDPSEGIGTITYNSLPDIDKPIVITLVDLASGITVSLSSTSNSGSSSATGSPISTPTLTENVKISKIEITSPGLAVASSGVGYATYKILDQNGNDITSYLSRPNNIIFKNDVTTINAGNGILTLTPNTGINLGELNSIVITASDSATGVSTSATLTIDTRQPEQLH